MESTEATESTATFTLKNALELLSNKCPDYLKRYKAIFNGMGKDLDSPFADYVEAITTTPTEWMKSFPDTDKSKPALAKSKTGMLYLLEHDKVKAALTPEVCSTAVTALTNAWKAHNSAIAKYRQGQVAKAPSTEVPTDDDCSFDSDIEIDTSSNTGSETPIRIIRDGVGGIKGAGRGKAKAIATPQLNEVQMLENVRMCMKSMIDERDLKLKDAHETIVQLKDTIVQFKELVMDLVNESSDGEKHAKYYRRLLSKW